MADQEYYVVFRGHLLPDWPMEAVRGNLAKLFKADAARIEALFSGQPVIIKKGLSRSEGERYRELFAKAGAVCEVVPAATPPPPPPAKTDASTVDTPEGGGRGTTGRAARSDARTQGAAPASRRPREGGADTSGAPAGDLRQTLGGLPNKIREMDTGEAGEKIAALVKGASASVRSGLRREALTGSKRSKLIAGAAGVVAILIALVFVLGGGSKPMPIEKDVFDRFAHAYYSGIRQSDIASAGTRVLVEQAREVVEDMGFDFDRTLLLWFLHKDQVERREGLDIYRTLLVEPVAVAVSAGLSGIDTQIAPETRQVFETAAAVPPGVDLKAIRMIRACPSDGFRLKHDDLLQVLAAHGISIDGDQPDLSIADTFFGLERAGFIKIHRRWENDVQFSDIEVLAPDAMRQTEQNLLYLAEIKDRVEPP